MLTASTRTITLPPGETVLRKPLDLKGSAANLAIRGAPGGSTLVMAADFVGRAAIVIEKGSHVTLSRFQIKGNRAELKSDWYLPTDEAAFADYYPMNGIVIRDSSDVSVRNVRISGVRTFPVLVNAASGVTIDGVSIADSGTVNSSGRNNTTGGILFEEGVSRFTVIRSTFQRLTGSAIWTHSYSRSPRNAEGRIVGNAISDVGRDAIQIGHATKVRVVGNRGTRIGFPSEYVDAEHHGTPVALDTAGNVDKTAYVNNIFTDVNGQCINLDGFHDGEVTGNSCRNEKPGNAYPNLHYAIVFGNNNPEMESVNVTISRNTLRGFAYGGLFLIGSNHRVEGNEFTRLNLAHCGTVPVPPACNYALDQPDLLRSGIYLGANGGRQAKTRNNTIEKNRMEGFTIDRYCVVAGPGADLSENHVGSNVCTGAAAGR